MEALSSPTLGPLRAALVDELVTLAGDRSACRRALGISASQDVEIDRNAALRSAATLPAVSRYTGVLYDALDVESLRGAAAGRAHGPACDTFRVVRAAAGGRPRTRIPPLRHVKTAGTTEPGRSLATTARTRAGRAGRRRAGCRSAIGVLRCPRQAGWRCESRRSRRTCRRPAHCGEPFQQGAQGTNRSRPCHDKIGARRRRCGGGRRSARGNAGGTSRRRTEGRRPRLTRSGSVGPLPCLD